MSNPLQFISKLDKALRASNPRVALRQLFKSLLPPEGKPRPDTESEYLRIFMSYIWKSFMAREERATWAKAMGEWTRPPGLTIRVEKDDQPYRNVPWDPRMRVTRLEHLTLGSYRILLDTGLVIWEGTITREEIRQLTVAADTGRTSRGPVRTWEREDLGLRLVLYPGLEGGRLDIISGERKP